MVNRNLARGVVLMALALGFGLPSVGYSLGKLSHAGPGLFPFIVSCMLFAIGVITVVRSRLVAPAPLNFQVRNISIILGSLCGFAALSHYVNMIAGIVFLVFCSGFAGTSYSVVRNLKIAAVLVGIAFMFQKLLGVNLPLF
ncbi:tripartite tricarboxylate transporter TctB [Acidovorax sp. Leaf76]|jgi:NADH:ubiquinone oxidoreductase subunit K|uniref:tripartite tricarboxylate transporter TctB family protein n=1 Tax=unclassified Acidovorax TaxID=2684926 RepID=UPI0006F322EC|nr:MULTISPECIES: tripartite tricarboxylate transporter TctB family protein [unclassified Acidovorax]KQO12637.1 tripartite tricarboxylate transporter TctB [Acidovorax sp. Leaf76]KQO19896.1 tripartite tricarboxylate transporter TctB [Acidovorax sp. Leaf78]KQO30245.1 tripartite tricarboxylate transporter TctB [Acidovorax sp. Leaf84]KQS28685.1 tripartite tricarboxylate transporter TctB [Acidovorax sp. Leaf191]